MLESPFDFFPADEAALSSRSPGAYHTLADPLETAIPSAPATVSCAGALQWFTQRYIESIGPPPILIIDDDFDGSTATASILTEGGYEVAAEARGDIVLQLVRASIMRLVVSEIYIACSEGRCVVAALKHDRSRLPRLRVLVHTRHTSPSDLEWALAAGGDAYVGKPTGTGVLLREVQRLDSLLSA